MPSVKIAKKLINSFKQKRQESIEAKKEKKQQQELLQAKNRQEEKKRRKKYEQALERNPYFQSKALWNDMYGSVQTKLENSYKIIMILSFVIVAAILGFVIVSGQTKVKPMPFIVHGNEVLTVSNSQAASVNSVKPKLALYFAKKFIRDARSVSVDGDVNANNRIAALSFVSGAAVPVLNTFYEKNDPNTIAQNYVKSVKITSVLRISPSTLDVRWKEIWRSARSGELVRSQNYIAQLTYRYSTPSENSTILQNNPMGFDIAYLSWSKDTEH